jgi:hypothetical protein
VTTTVLERALDGDELAFRELTEPFRRELELVAESLDQTGRVERLRLRGQHAVTCDHNALGLETPSD